MVLSDNTGGNKKPNKSKWLHIIVPFPHFQLSMQLCIWWPVSICNSVCGGQSPSATVYVVAILLLQQCMWWPVSICNSVCGGQSPSATVYVVASLHLQQCMWWPVSICNSVCGGQSPSATVYVVASLLLQQTCMGSVINTVHDCGSIPMLLELDMRYLFPHTKLLGEGGYYELVIVTPPRPPHPHTHIVIAII